MPTHKQRDQQMFNHVVLPDYHFFDFAGNGLMRMSETFDEFLKLNRIAECSSGGGCHGLFI
jgi:hypothetical protein